jgi:tetratricopeptide (TPR) repeat protein
MKWPAVIAALLLLLLPVMASAEDDGGVESAFDLGAGARPMAMGNAYTALAEDATAVYYNPAGLPYLPSQEITFLHTVLFEGTVYDYVAYVYPYTSIGGFGIAGMRLGTDDIGRRDLFTDIGRFNSTQMQVLLSYGRRFGHRISGGTTLKLANQSIADYSDYGFGLDLAGRYSITDRLRAGLVLQDIIGARMKLLNDRERTPFVIRGGLAYLYQLTDRPFSGAVTFDLEKPEYRNVKIRAGLEVAHSSGLAVRGGYDRDNFTFGIGIKYQQLMFDYAYKFIDNLMDSHRFSLSFNFGPTRQEIEARRETERRRGMQQYLRESREDALRREMDQGEEYFREGRLDSALAAYYRAEAFADQRAKAQIKERVDQIKNLLAEEELPLIPEPVTPVAPDEAALVARQAVTLIDQGSLAAARDIVDAAFSQGVQSDELTAIRRDIANRINDRIRTTLRQADQAFNQGNFIDAYSKYQEVLTYDKNNLRASDGARAARLQIDLAQHLKLGMDYFEQGRYILSQRELNTVLQLDPRNETALEYLKRIDSAMKETATPEEQDLRKDSVMWQAYLDGVEAYRAGDFKKAIQYWEEVLKKYPNNRMTLENIRQARLRLEEQ